MRKFTDCGNDGCDECDVCKYLNFLDWAQSVAPANSTVERNKELDKYIAEKYPQRTEAEPCE